MIVTTDIGSILYKDCEVFGLDIFQMGNVPQGDVTIERIAILPKPQVPGVYWNTCLVDVNLYVPDAEPNTANLLRLKELERHAFRVLNDVISSYDGTTYCYSIDSISIEADTALKCHYVNCRIMFKVLNLELC